ncbi:hypothetical protein [Bradyrhizobium tropiciagri]|nr:hypothetical protein [Bradyrhizobium tropiciagri]
MLPDRANPARFAFPDNDETSQIPVSKMIEQNLNALVAWLRTIPSIE